jgi:hypothetical protein
MRVSAPARPTLAAPPPLLWRVGVVLHPERDVGDAVAAVAEWGRHHDITVVAADRPG